MNGVNVKDNMNATTSSTFFIEQKADADAAYQRLAITRKALKMYQREINDTNISDITGELKELYSDLERTMKLIMLSEQQLIFDGE